MKPGKPSSELPDPDGASSSRALLEEFERLRTRVAYRKNLEALVRGQSATRPQSVSRHPILHPRGVSSRCRLTQRAQAVLGPRPDYPLQVLLAASGLQRSTFYYQAKGLEAGDKHASLESRIGRYCR